MQPTTSTNRLSRSMTFGPASRLARTAQIIAGLILASVVAAQASPLVFTPSSAHANREQASFSTPAPRSAGVDFAALAEEAGPAIFMVGYTDDRGGFTLIGTGFAIDDSGAGGVVATNAHVAEALNESIAHGYHPIVRRPELGAARDFAVVSAPEVHPGYRRWSGLSVRGLLRRSANGPEPFQLIPPADVALLRTEPGLGASLRMASPDRARTLRAGEQVMYLGFPGENMVGPRENAPPLMGVGYVAAVSGIGMDFASPEDAVIVHHTILFTGGSSGGPILAPDPVTGEPVVVAVHSAANHIQLEGARVPVTNAYAQRVDLLRELADGSARSNQIARDAEWIRAINRVAIPFADRLEAIRGAVDPEGRMRRSDSRFVTLGGRSRMGRAGRDAGDPVIRIHVEAGAEYSVIATSENWEDVDLSAFAGGRLLAEDNAPDAYPIVRWTAPYTGEVTIRLTAPDESDSINVEVWLLEINQPRPAGREGRLGG